MQGISLKQNLTHKLSPQQIQFMKLLQTPAYDISKYIEKEIETNPILEIAEDTNVSEDINEHNFSVRSWRTSYRGEFENAVNFQPVPYSLSLNDKLLEQLSLANLNEKEVRIGKYIIGTLNGDGYFTQSIETIIEDLFIYEGLSVSDEEVEKVLKVIQTFDPVGIGSTSLEECLVTQLTNTVMRKSDIDLGVKIIKNCFSEFKRNNFERIISKLGVTDKDSFLRVIKAIKALSRSPGRYAGSADEMGYNRLAIYPDFVLIKEYDELKVTLNKANLPEVRISQRYLKILDEYNRSKDSKLEQSALFVKKKLESAKSFIDSIKQRHKTLLLIVETIVSIQHNFFSCEDEANLKPMNLRAVAEKVGMDVSTVSRCINSKYIQTNFSIYPLRFFFSNYIELGNGDKISNRLVKSLLNEIVQNEDSNHPYTDEEIRSILVSKGYDIARRTIAKYKRQLNIPPARLRRKIQSVG
jgi:RNA polymerase sigma-54 factor